MKATPSLPAQIRHLIVDRDGVLNREAADHGYILRPQDFEWLPGSLQALVTLTALGLRISIASNQSAVGRGLMTSRALEEVLQVMRDQALAAGAHISAVYICPHAPEAHCDCRKPAPGLIRSAVRDSGIPESQTLLVGDDVRDVEAAQAAGITAVLVRTGKGLRASAQLQTRGAILPVFDDLARVALELMNRSTATHKPGLTAP